jgi:hypothetical protein
MLKHEAISLFGSVEKLRTALGLKTRHAIYMWPNDQPIPEPHEIKIRFVLKPECFNAAGELIQPIENKAA